VLFDMCLRYQCEARLGFSSVIKNLAVPFSKALYLSQTMFRICAYTCEHDKRTLQAWLFCYFYSFFQISVMPL